MVEKDLNRNRLYFVKGFRRINLTWAQIKKKYKEFILILDILYK